MLNKPPIEATAVAGTRQNQVLDCIADMTVDAWMQTRVVPQSDLTISTNQRTSISALIAYVAHQSGSNEFRIERQVADRFNIANVMCLPVDQYDAAVRYLVDGLEAKV